MSKKPSAAETEGPDVSPEEVSGPSTAEKPRFRTETWGGEPLYVCPRCGRTSFEQSVMEAHVRAFDGCSPLIQE